MMPESKKIILLGAGGHCKSVLDTLLELNCYETIGIIDKKEVYGEYTMENRTILGVPLIGSDDDLEHLLQMGYTDAFLTMGNAAGSMVRQKLYRHLKELGFHIPNIIDKTSLISRNTLIGEGNFIGKKAIINAYAKIHDCTIINTGSIIEHECHVESFVHLAPGSILCGGVWVKEGTHIGAGSVVKQGIHIGANTMIGMGSVVVKDIDSNKKAYGNPCREV